MHRHAIPDIEYRTKLAERGLECYLLLNDGDRRAFESELCGVLGTLLEDSYGGTLTPECLYYETWAVVIAPSPTEAPVACATLSFTAEYPSYFATRFEAVHPSLQGTGLGRILFDCIASWCRFLVFNDELAQQGVLASDGNYCLVSYIDAPSQDGEWVGPRDNPSGHGAFLQKIGFTHAQHDFGQNEDELAFQRAFRISIKPWQDACEDE